MRTNMAQTKKHELGNVTTHVAYAMAYKDGALVEGKKVRLPVKAFGCANFRNGSFLRHPHFNFRCTPIVKFQDID